MRLLQPRAILLFWIIVPNISGLIARLRPRLRREIPAPLTGAQLVAAVARGLAALRDAQAGVDRRRVAALDLEHQHAAGPGQRRRLLLEHALPGARVVD